MIIKNKTCYVFDIEVLPNCFTCTLINSESLEETVFEFSERKSQHRELIQFFADRSQDSIFAGYNIRHYDTPMINYIISMLNTNAYTTMDICNSLKRLSDIIIRDKDGANKKLYSRYKYANYFDSIDLATMIFPRMLMASLKSLEITMHFQNVQEMRIDWNANIPIDKIDDLLRYNRNDVLATLKLLNDSEQKIRIREQIEIEYGIQCLSLDDVTTGVSVLEKRYFDQTGEKPMPVEYHEPIPMTDVIFDRIHFKSKILNDVLSELKQYVHNPLTKKDGKTFYKKFAYNGLMYGLGIGGLHSINRPMVIKPKDDEELVDIDAESLYPNMILKNACAPRHLGDSFLITYEKILEDRLLAKHSGDMNTNITLKFALNGVSGNMDRPGSWLNDPLSVLRIRINGQLLFLMLTERLTEIGCTVVSANTDGLTLIVPKHLKQAQLDICKEWEEMSRLTLEHVEYEKLVVQTVNSYIAVKKGFSDKKTELDKDTLIKKYVKTKNKFLMDIEPGKGLVTPRVVPKALINYFIFNEPIEDTILKETDIRLFLMSEKTSRDFKVRHGLDLDIQLFNRFYVSKSGAYLCKYKEAPDNFSKILTQPVIVLNNLDDAKPVAESDIYYPYYLNACREIIHTIEPRQQSLF